MDTLLPALAYLAGGAACHVLAWAVGAAVAPWGAGASGGGTLPGEVVIRLLVRWALGVGVVGTLVLLLGLVGWLSPAPLGAAIATLAALGLARVAGGARDAARDGAAAARRAGRGVRAASWPARLVAASGAVLVVHLLVGGLAPDTSHDAMWYHLTIPAQWMLRGDVAMFGHHMPSCYTLLVEAAHVPMLMVSDEVLVTSFHAQALVGALLLTAWTGWQAGGAGGAMLAASLLVPLLALQAGIVPLTAKHDTVVALQFAAAVWLPWVAAGAEPGRRGPGGREPTTGEALAAGALLGFAVAGKIVVALFAPALVVAAAGVVAQRGGTWRAGARFLALAGAAAAGVYLPWLLRAWLETGNPLFQVAPRLVPFDPEFTPVVEAMEYQERLFPFTAAGVVAAAADFPAKLRLAGTMLYALFFLLPVAAVAALARPGASRWLGGAIAANFLVLGMLDGANETIRYGSIFFLAVMPAAAGLLGWLAEAAGPRRAGAIALLFLAAAGGSYVRRQADWGAMATINWPYRPVLSAEERLVWGARTELGAAFTAMARLDAMLPREATLLVADHPGPYYLRRRVWWGDYICVPFLEDDWAGVPPAAVEEALRARGVTHVLFLGGVVTLGAAAEAERAGVLRRARGEAAAVEGIVLYEVAGAAGGG